MFWCLIGIRPSRLRRRWKSRRDGIIEKIPIKVITKSLPWDSPEGVPSAEPTDDFYNNFFWIVKRRAS